MFRRNRQQFFKKNKKIKMETETEKEESLYFVAATGSCKHKESGKVTLITAHFSFDSKSAFAYFFKSDQDLTQKFNLWLSRNGHKHLYFDGNIPLIQDEVLQEDRIDPIHISLLQ